MVSREPIANSLPPVSEATPLLPLQRSAPLTPATRCYPSRRDMPVTTGDDAVNGPEEKRIAASLETVGS
jgi:hypothetical protein